MQGAGRRGQTRPRLPVRATPSRRLPRRTRAMRRWVVFGLRPVGRRCASASEVSGRATRSRIGLPNSCAPIRVYGGSSIASMRLPSLETSNSRMSPPRPCPATIIEAATPAPSRRPAHHCRGAGGVDDAVRRCGARKPGAAPEVFAVARYRRGAGLSPEPSRRRPADPAASRASRHGCRAGPRRCPRRPGCAARSCARPARHGADWPPAGARG